MPNITGCIYPHGGSYRYENAVYLGGWSTSNNSGPFDSQRFETRSNVLLEAQTSNHTLELVFRASKGNAIYGGSKISPLSLVFNHIVKC